MDWNAWLLLSKNAIRDCDDDDIREQLEIFHDTCRMIPDDMLRAVVNMVSRLNVELYKI